ncbi:MAG TPA: ATP-binding cassette domain-containing protein, partial [Ornithinibacter sp.]|nr:ATP-binding cassette domain-containing protein [Ornithinibacter sp.]
GLPSDLMVDSDIAPPVVELGRYAGWSPLPLSVRDARRAARGLRTRLQATLPPGHDRPTGRSAHAGDAVPAAVALSARDVVVRYPGDVLAVAEVDLDLHPGEVTAVMGRNGCGKSSLLWALQGSGILTSGTVRATRPAAGSATAGTASETVEPRSLGAGDRRSLVGLVPQTAADLLYLDTVGAECDQADRESGVPSGTCASLLEAVAPGIPAEQHPRDLSEGQKLALVLAVQLTADPPVLLLDEPTRGLDPTAKAALSLVLRGLAARGRSVVVSTHDVEFVAEVADRVVVMAAGEVVADGPTTEVVVSSPAFAPQVSKVTAPGPWLTVDDVREALAVVAS